MEIRKNIDTFIDDLWRATYWNSWAAVTACAAAVASAVVALCEVFVVPSQSLAVPRYSLRPRNVQRASNDNAVDRARHPHTYMRP